MNDSFSSLVISDKTLPRKILVAVDFGTTYSGIAWAQTRKPEKQAIIQQWPKATLTDEKVPTTLQYKPFRWGFQTNDTERKHEWFKLGLDPVQERETNLARKYPSTTALPPGNEEFCEKLVVDYLTALREHTAKVLKQRLLNELSDVVLRDTPLKYIITVPAVWSDKAMAKTRSCAKRAGMGSGDSLQIISEPEAAGIYALDAMDPLGLHINDTFVVCDAGGGTVDLVSYTVSALKPVARLREAVPGSGGLCGSIFLNRIFEKYMKDRFERNTRWDDEVMADAMEYFDSSVKRTFEGDLGKEFFVPVPGLADDGRAGIKRGKLRLSGKEVQEIFEPVIREILKLVMDQIRATVAKNEKVKAVLLVGGFGSNAYLRSRIQAEVGKHIQVKEVINSWTAVVRGALIKGLAEVSPTLATITVDTRIARKHYGTCCWVPFEKGKHDPRRKESNSFMPSGYHIELMNWFIRKGTPVEESKPKPFPFYWEQRVDYGRPRAIPMTVYDCLDPMDTGAPEYPGDSITELVKLSADLSSIPERQLHRKRGADNELYYNVDFDIEMTCYSASTKFTLIYEGKEYHTVTAEYV